MAFQFILSHQDHSHGRLPQNSMPPSTPHDTIDWHAQRSLYMGSKITPQYCRQVSFTSPDLTMTNHMSLVASVSQLMPTEQAQHLPGKVLYPSSSYRYGNPGYYYDPLQFPVSSETQTSPAYVQYQSTSIQGSSTPSPHAPNSFLSPSDGRNVQGVTSPQNLCTPRPVDLLCTSNDDCHSINNNCLPSPSQHINEQIPTCHPCMQDVGCQVTSLTLTPVTVYKEAKKLSLSTFDPVKMSWTSFAMKLHASLIECDTGYLLHETHTNSTNTAHSKELMLELFRKLQGSALSLFTSLNSQHFY
jgi:hypothetical protein